GAAQPPSEARTGPAPPGRSVCAPGAMAVSFYRRPARERRGTMWFPVWSALGRLCSERGTARRNRASPRLTVERLEDRPGPAAYPAADVPQLIQAIRDANATADADTITLAPGTTFSLTAVDNTAHGATGLPTILAAGGDLTIVGNGDTIERKSGNGTPAFRLFDVAPGGALTLKNVTLRGGFAYGGGGA